MNYDILTASAFTASAKLRSASVTAWAVTRYVAPRLFGLWLWSVAIVFAGLAYVGHRAYASGQLFRAQYNEGYQRPIAGLLMPVIEDVDLPTIPEMFAAEDEPSIFPDVREQVSALKWQDLRKVGKALGYTHKNKSALLTALTEETDLDDLYEAYQDVVNA